MLRRSSSIMNRVGSYFGLENTDSSLDMWKEKIERAAKMDALTISLANMLPSDLNDQDKDIKLLEDILAQSDDMGDQLSTHLMSNSTEEIVSVQVFRHAGDSSTWHQEQESEMDCTTAKRVWISANDSNFEEDVEAEEKTPKSSESTLQDAVEMKTLQDPNTSQRNQQEDDDVSVSKEMLIESCSLHRPSDAMYRESNRRIQDRHEVSATDSESIKPKGILAHKEKWKVEELDGVSSCDHSAGQDEMLTGSAALDYYDLLCKAREEAIESERERGLLESLKKKEELLDAVMTSAIDCRKASNQTQSWFQRFRGLWCKSQYNSIKPHPTLSSQIRIQIEGLPEYKPYVTVVITITQIITFLVLCFFGGIAPVGLRPITIYLDNVKTFRGTETVTSQQYPNVWIGPTATYWIRRGALFAPCLRSDYKINVMLSKQGYQMTAPLGCCEVETRNTAGTTTEQQCYDMTYGVGNWRPLECSSRPSGDNNIAHILKPCCSKLTGECKLTTHQHCTFLGGYYHKQGPEHCSQVNCLADICGLGGLTMQADPGAPYMPVQPNQWWRLMISPFYHNGILHLILVLIPQLLLAVPIERMAGGIRLFLIYSVSQITGYLLASFFTPYLPHVGSSAAVCGLIAVQTIEVAQSWVLVKRPHIFILKLFGILFIFLLSGTLPYLNNFAHIGGLVSGTLAGVIFLPYIVFGQWHSRRRRLLLFLAAPSLALILSMLLLLFYMVQGAEFCSTCHYINCIPYTPSLCNSTWYNPQPSV